MPKIDARHLQNINSRSVGKQKGQHRKGTQTNVLRAQNALPLTNVHSLQNKRWLGLERYIDGFHANLAASGGKQLLLDLRHVTFNGKKGKTDAKDEAKQQQYEPPTPFQAVFRVLETLLEIRVVDCCLVGFLASSTHLRHTDRLEGGLAPIDFSLQAIPLDLGWRRHFLARRLHRFGLLRERAEKAQLAVLQGVERFLVIGRQFFPSSGHDRTSVLVFIHDKPGALFDVLSPFARHGISMNRIESRPSHNAKWEYAFFIDLAGHPAQDNVAAALQELRAQCSFFKVLGSFPLDVH